MVKKKSPDVKTRPARSANAGGGGPVEACEVVPVPRPLAGDYYFVVKIVPVNSTPTMDPQYKISSTVHFADGPAQAATRGNKTYQIVAGATREQSKKAFRFEVSDGNSKLDSLDATLCAIDSKDGRDWLRDAIDYAVLKVNIS